MNVMVQAVVVSLQTPGAPSQRPSEDTQPFIKEQHESATLLTVFWFILVINWRTLARQTHENSGIQLGCRQESPALNLGKQFFSGFGYT